MINLSNASLRRGTQTLFAGANITIHQGNRVGIVGANGCGKSSLFELLLGRLEVDEGEISLPPELSIAYVIQEVPAIDRSAIEYVIDGDQELREIQQQMKSAESGSNGILLAQLHNKLEEINAYSVNSRAAKLMNGLGFSNDQLNKPVNSFSGGWRMRLNLAQALICRSDILLLDEPTNHLDLDAVIWLENWLINYSGTLLLISHDRDVLDRVVNNIIYFEHKDLLMISGNYSQYEKIRAEQLAQQAASYEKQQREIKHIQSFVQRFKAKASKARQAQSRLKTLQRMELISQAHIDTPFSFVFFMPEKVPYPLIRLEDVDVGYGKNSVLSDINLTISPGDRVGVLGHNGSGKSTLIKLIASELKPLVGTITVSGDIKAGYFAQHQLELLDMQESALVQFQRRYKKVTEQEVRDYLGGFNFHGDQVSEPVGQFSGGEKARLVLAIIIFDKPNLLLLDEPTNHLDLEMRSALTMALQDYEGGVLLVSHDRYLLNAVTDQFIMVEEGRVKVFDGDLEDYRQCLIKSRKNDDYVENTPDSERGLTKKEIRQIEAEKRQRLQPLQKKIRELELEIGKLAQEKDKLAVIMMETELYSDKNREKLKQYLIEQTQVTDKLKKKEEEWFILTDSLEQDSL
ncbi:MAG: ATP-binding cassette domain-containing protein [Gammaproteobacteria bacterium]|nr:ATP-binding cassette domain-containing protein [Gammaproteobacteria bacterium]